MGNIVESNAFVNSVKLYGARAVDGTVLVSSASQVYTDLTLTGGDGTGITVPDPGGAGATAFISFTACAWSSAECAAFFDIFVDGVYVAGAAPYTSAVFGTPTIVEATVTAVVPLAAGAPHTIKIRWKANVGQLTIDTTEFAQGNAPAHASLSVFVAPS